MEKERIYFDPSNLWVVKTRELPPKERVSPSVPVSSRMIRMVLMWENAVLEDKLFRPGRTIYIGRSMRNDLVMPTIGLPAKFPLITGGKDKVVLRLPLGVEAFEGLFQLGDELYDLERACREKGKKVGDDVYEIELSAADRGVIEIGYLTLYFDFVPVPPEIEQERPLDRLDPFFLKMFMIMLIIFLVLLTVMQVMPKKEKKTIEDIEKRFAKAILEPKIEPRTVKFDFTRWGKKRKIKTKKSMGKEGQGARRAGKEGKRGRLNPSRRGVTTKKRTIDQAGVLEVFSKSRKYSALADLLGGEGGLGSDVDKYFRPGGSRGKGERWARGIKGTGLGGGGTARTGIGGLGTKGRGTGRVGYGKADLGGKGESAVTAVIEESETYVMGQMDKQAILKVILNNIDAIRYCYERELTQHPSLSGKLVVDFVIGTNGRVRSSSVIRTTMNNPRVERCVASRIRRLVFPKPSYGIVEVKFPFVFRSEG